MEPKTISKNGVSLKNQMSRKNPYYFGILLFLVAVIGIGIIVNAQVPSTRSNKDQIMGVWKYPPTPGQDTEIKYIITKGYWIMIFLKDNVIQGAHGGTYYFDGETLIENSEFGTSQWENIKGVVGKFKIKFEGNRMNKSGTVSDQRINEYWDRVE